MIVRNLIVVLALAIAACDKRDSSSLTGYVEAELIYLAPQDGGVVKTLAVREGDRVEGGDVVFSLDPARLSLAARQADAAAEGMAARAGEGGALAKEIVQAEAALVLAEKTFRRSRELVKDGAIAKEKYDADASALASARARVGQARAEQNAMQREWEAATASARLAAERLADLETKAPLAGSIERIYRRPGEVVAAGDPVVALLPPANLKLRFFAPERLLATMQVGAKVMFTCDRCSGPRAARISYVAIEPQFTPPVIYSLEERDKLVFLVEARPEDPSGLRPGLPVTITPP